MGNCVKCNRKRHYAQVCKAKVSQGQISKASFCPTSHERRRLPRDWRECSLNRHLLGGQHLWFPTLLPRSISRDQISWKILIRKGEQFNLNPPSENIYAANNSRFNALRTLNLEVRYMGRSAFIEVHIVNKPCVLLLSLQACRDLTVVPPYFPRSIKSEGR